MCGVVTEWMRHSASVFADPRFNSFRCERKFSARFYTLILYYVIIFSESFVTSTFFRLLGFDRRTMPEELCGLFWDYGMTDIQVSAKHVFIEFGTK